MSRSSRRRIVGAGLLTTSVVAAMLTTFAGTAHADEAGPILDDLGCVANDLGPNDDGESEAQELDQTLVVDGTSYGSLVVDNNGLISLVPEESSTPLLNIAALDYDIDTDPVGEGIESGTVTWGQGSFGGRSAWCANYRGVSPFSGNEDQYNDFQILLVDRSDLAPGDFDVVLNYAAILYRRNIEPITVYRGEPYFSGEDPRETLYTSTGFADDWSRLVTTSLNSDVPGRHVLEVRDGIVEASRAPQAVTFAEGSPTRGVVGDSFIPEATGGGSENPVVFSIDPESEGVCSMPNLWDDTISRRVVPSEEVDDDYQVHFDAPGMCVVRADQDGDEAHEPGSAQLVIEVRRASSGGGGGTPAPAAAPTTTSVVTTSRTMTATVAASGATPTTTPTGSVTFTVDGEPVGTVALTPTNGRVGTATATLRERVSTDGSHTVGAAYAGTTSWASSTGTYERRNPTLTSRVVSSRGPNAAGWYRTPVTVRFTCTPGSADLAGDCPDPISRKNTEPGTRVERSIAATDGGADTVSVPLQVDTIGPKLQVTRVGKAPWTPQARPVRCTATDARSGLDGDCSISYGDLVTGPRGGTRRTWTATATDVAGNTTTRQGSYAVR